MYCRNVQYQIVACGFVYLQASLLLVSSYSGKLEVANPKIIIKHVTTQLGKHSFAIHAIYFLSPGSKFAIFV